MTTGMSESSGLHLSALSTAQPSIPGMMTSRVMADGRSSRARLRPSAPLGGADDVEAFLGQESGHEVAARSDRRR